MDIIILSNFCMDFSASDNDRFLYIAKMLEKESTVEMITSDFYHTKKKRRILTNVDWPFKITFLHECGYPRNVCLKRFYSHYLWGRNVKKYLEHRKKADVIYCAVPSLTAAYYAAKYCAKNKVRFIIDVQDLWPEAFQMIFNIPILKTIFFAPFKFVENKVFNSADSIIAVSQTYVDRALEVNKKCRDGYAVYLGTDINAFDKNAEIPNELLKADEEIWIGYCGTLGESYDLKCVIEAIRLVQNSHLKLIVMGDGPSKNSFEQYAKEKQVNTVFTGRLQYDKMCPLLCKCDIVANPIVGRSVASIINKHADYAASGLPVINTQNSKEYKKLINDYNMGFSVEPGDYKGFAEKLQLLIDTPLLRKKMGANARKCAEEKFDRKITYNKIKQVILERGMK